MASQCSDQITITGQGDIDNGAGHHELEVRITNATGTLNFTSLSEASLITVSDSPQLEELYFPSLNRIIQIFMENTQSLLSVSLPNITGVQLNITDAPILTELNLNRVDGFWDFTLIDVPNLDTDSINFMSWANRIEVDFCPTLYHLNYTLILSILASETCPIILSLASVGDLLLRNLNGIHLAADSFDVEEQFMLDSSTSSITSYDVLAVGAITTVGSSANITSNYATQLPFESLAFVGGDLRVINNTNCTLVLDHLTEAENIFMLDNVNTTLPILPALKTVGDIHLRGDIDTSHGSNIFPALTLASGTVTIEAWNDFNCSKLVAQKSDGIIYNLVCNGSRNGTDDINPTMQTSTTGLSRGAWAGVGVGIGIVVIGGIMAVIWCVFYFRRLIKTIRKGAETQEDRHDSSRGRPDWMGLEGLQQLDGQGIVQEKPDDHRHEMQVPPTEKPDDQIYELSSAPTLLSSNAACSSNTTAERYRYEDGTDMGPAQLRIYAPRRKYRREDGTEIEVEVIAIKAINTIQIIVNLMSSWILRLIK